MPVHLAHALLSLDAVDVTADTDYAFAPSADGLLPVVGSQFQVPRELRVAAAWAGAETATKFPGTNDSLADVRLETPALAEINPASIRPLTPLTSGLPADGLRITDYACEPLPLRAGDPLSSIGTIAANGSAAIDIDAHALIWLTDGCQPAPPVPSIIVPFVLAAAPPITTLAWVPNAIRFLRPLPGRRFGILGLELVASAGILAGRLSLPGSPLKPGVLAGRLSLPGSPLKPGVLAASGTNASSFRQARLLESMHLGVLGEFDAYAPPTLETYSVASPAAAQIRGWMRIVPLDGRTLQLSSGFAGGKGFGGGSCGTYGGKG